MTKKILRLVVLVAFVAIGFWAYTIFFPNPRQAITHQLNKLARLGSFRGDEGNYAKVAKIERLGAIFSEDAQVSLDVPGYEPYTLRGRAEIMQAAALSKRLGNSIHAEFIDMNIEMGSDNTSALVDLTLKAKVDGESEFIAQEMKFTMKKIKGDWLVTRVEPVKTLKP